MLIVAFSLIYNLRLLCEKFLLKQNVFPAKFFQQQTKIEANTTCIHFSSIKNPSPIDYSSNDNPATITPLSGQNKDPHNQYQPDTML